MAAALVIVKGPDWEVHIEVPESASSGARKLRAAGASVRMVGSTVIVRA